MGYKMLDDDRFDYKAIGRETDLISAAINFIHERCENLRFEDKDEKGKLLGRSIEANQIPYNMQMDLDRLCFENALKRFLMYGSKKNAFDVYFCYIEMFIGKYAACRRMIEMLSEYESNGGSLLMKHRDHYSHSVNVFALGLAIYETNSSFREKYKNFYGIKNEQDAAHNFLKFWGLTALFHDIGYPFELPFEQVESYFEVNKKKRKDCPYMAYRSLDILTTISKETNKQLMLLFKEDFKDDEKFKGFDDTNSLFAFDIAKKLGKEYRVNATSLEVVLRNKPVAPDCFGYYMDHAYFSANLLFSELSSIKNNGEPYRFEVQTIDALTAILLHNSLYKFSVAFYNSKLNIPFKAELHPLAYLLMLCDELQCWNRTSYGRNSRTELHPMNCNLKFIDGKIEADYIFDKSEMPKIKKFKKEYENNPKKAELKAFSKMYISDKEENQKKCSFLADIERIVDTSFIPLSVSYSFADVDHKYKNEYLSSCNFIHLYNFAAALNARYNCSTKGKEYNVLSKEEQEEQFDELSLEYKLSNIGQAKAFDEYLNEIGCFYTDKDVDFKMKTKFNKNDMNKIGPLEHLRWVREHLEMGWKFGEPKDKAERENKRIHNLMMDIPKDADEETVDELITKHYYELEEKEQNKDTDPMNFMLELIKEFEGLRIYKLNKR